MGREMLTAEKVRALIGYDPEAGLFTRLVVTASSVNVGDIAGDFDSHGYRRISVLNKRWQAHRLAWLIMTGEWPADQIDHINGIRDDNRWCNLREVSHQMNQRNLAKYSNNSSGIVGVRWHSQRGKWVVEISGRYVGIYKTIFEAAAVRKSAELINGFHINHGRG